MTVNIAGIILAAGLSRRMGADNKLLQEVEGEALIRRVSKVAQFSDLSGVIVVSGHQSEDVSKALEGADLTLVHNSKFADGMSTSIRVGIEALDDKVSHAMILLGDMPNLSVEDLNKLISCSAKEPDKITISTSNGSQANPVIWPRSFFDELTKLEGDKGARELIQQHRDHVQMVEIGEAARVDLDTPDDFASFSSDKD